MSQRISKNQICKYHAFLHEVTRDRDNMFYCRAMNAVTDIDYYCCKERFLYQAVRGNKGEERCRMRLA